MMFTNAVEEAEISSMTAAERAASRTV